MASLFYPRTSFQTGIFTFLIVTRWRSVIFTRSAALGSTRVAVMASFFPQRVQRKFPSISRTDTSPDKLGDIASSIKVGQSAVSASDFDKLADLLDLGQAVHRGARQGIFRGRFPQGS